MMDQKSMKHQRKLFAFSNTISNSDLNADFCFEVVCLPPTQLNYLLSSVFLLHIMISALNNKIFIYIFLYFHSSSSIYKYNCLTVTCEPCNCMIFVLMFICFW